MHPRVLLVSSSVFNPYSGGGITLGNLFKGWPIDRIAAAHSDALAPDEGICRRYYFLAQRELGWVWPLNRMAPRHEEPGAGPGPAAAPGAGIGRALARSQTGRWARRLLGALIPEAALQDHASVSEDLRRWVLGFRPELIYTLLGSFGFIRLVRQLSALTGAPVVVHMMDDWPATRYGRGWLGGLLRRRTETRLREILDSSAARLAISEAMCRAFEARYRLSFLAFHNVLDMDAWRAHGRSRWERGPTFRLLYSGSIELCAQLESLRDVAAAVLELRDQGLAIELSIRAPRHYVEAYRSLLERAPAVTVDGAPEPEEVTRVLSAADALVLPVNFDRRSIDYVRLSFPTKIPAYLASGSPILAYGPVEAVQIGLARRQGWGHVIDCRDRGTLKKALMELAADESLRERLGRRGKEVALEEHDAARVRPAFQRVLMEAAARGAPPEPSGGARP